MGLESFRGNQNNDRTEILAEILGLFNESFPEDFTGHSDDGESFEYWDRAVMLDELRTKVAESPDIAKLPFSEVSESLPSSLREMIQDFEQDQGVVSNESFEEVLDRMHDWIDS